VDIRGNPYGLLAAHPVAPLVSLHHLDYVDSIFPNMDRVDAVKKLVTAYKSDPGRTIQQSFCYDHSKNWSISISWGYSVELYPYLPTAKDLEMVPLTFKTWRTWSDAPFTFNTRSVSQDPCVKPLVYFMDRVEGLGRGLTRSGYKRYDDGSGKECDKVDHKVAHGIQYVNVSAPMLLPRYWKEVWYFSTQFVNFSLLSFFCCQYFLFVKCESGNFINNINIIIILGIQSLSFEVKNLQSTS